MQTTPENINILSVKQGEKRTVEEFRFNYSKIKKLVAFSFVDSVFCNFFVVTNNGIELYLFNPFKSAVKHIKVIPLACEYATYQFGVYRLFCFLVYKFNTPFC